MGINGLNKFLKAHCPDVFHQIKLSDLQYRKGAVDISLYIFKYKTIFGDNWLTALLNLISCLRKNDIHLCFIYDTSAPPEKNHERAERKLQREKMDNKLMILVSALEKARLTNEIDQVLVDFNSSLKTHHIPKLLNKSGNINLDTIEYEINRKLKQIVELSPDDFIKSKQMLDLIGVPWVQAPMEAETTCSDLCKQSKVDVVFSEDTDVLCYGAPIFITKVNTTDDTATLIYYDEILQSLDLTSTQFTDFCIMCGTDYNKNIFQIGPEKAFKLIKTYGSIEAIEQSGVNVNVLNHIRTREIFNNYLSLDICIPHCKPPNIKNLELFILTHNMKINIHAVKRNFQSRELIFD
jgi:5'-3' exonuclease